MYRIILSLSLLFLTTSCWTDSSSDGPQCTYESPKKMGYKFSTTPDELSVKMDQEKLTAFMSVKVSSMECYLLTQDNVTLSKIKNDENPINPELDPIPLATESVQQNLKAYEEDFKNGVLGLTTIQFTGGNNEQITGMQITIRDDAKRWHLWHEYSHVLIAEKRSENPNQSLYIPSEDFLNKKYFEIKNTDTSNTNYSLKLQKLLTGYRDHIDKTYVDEILIELTLNELVRQQASELAVDDEDWAQSRRAIDFFVGRYEVYYSQATAELEELLFDSSLSPENSLAITQVLGFLKNQHDVILKRVGDTEGNIGFIGTSEL